MATAARVASTTDGGDAFAVQLARTITSLLTFRGLKPAEASLRLGMSHGSWYRRMSDGNWTAWQMLQLSDLLDVDVAALYSPDEYFPRRAGVGAQNAK